MSTGSMSFRALWATLILTALLTIVFGLRDRTFAQQNSQTQNAGRRTQNGDNAELHVLKVQGNVYMLVGAGGNITISVGEDGVLLVDSGLAQMSDKVFAEVRKLSDKPIQFILNTHVHLDHTGGNENLVKLGQALSNRGNAGVLGAQIIAHDLVLTRMSTQDGNTPAAPFEALPTISFVNERKDVYFNGEAVQMFHQPAAHTDGDSVVFFRKSDVVSAGDVFMTTTYPIIDLTRGGTINGIIDALNNIIDITVPKNLQEGGTMVIPGHGRLCDEDDVVEYRDIVTIIRDRVQDMVKRGMTLEQVKAAKPTEEYDARYGATTGFWTTEMFVEAVYRSLNQKE